LHLISQYLLLKETFYYTLTKAIPGLTGLLSVIIFIRIFGSVQYGQYSFLIAQCNLIVALSFGWLNQAQLRYYSKDSISGDYHALQVKAISLSLLVSAVILSFFVFFQSLSIQSWIVSILIITSMGSFNYLKTIYQAKFLPKSIIIFTSWQSLLALLIPLGLLFFLEKNENILLIGIGLSFLLVVIFISFKDNNSLLINLTKWKKFQDDDQLIKKWYKFGIPLSIWFAAGLALPFLDRFFIKHYLPSEDLGIFSSLQELLTRLFSFLLFPFILALHPRIMDLWNKSNFTTATQLINRSIFIMLSVGTIIFFCIWGFSEFIFLGIKMIIPEFNIEHSSLTLPLFCAGFLWQISLLTHKMLELNEKTYLMVIAILPSIIINLIGNGFFLPTLGILATAYTAFFSALSYCIITSIYYIMFNNRIEKI